jgi:triphosphoribosyl-dephospho-CoA synthase
MTIMTFPDRAPAERPLDARPRIASTEAVMADRLADMAVEALLVEVHLTPKPGLVDRRNDGSHRDMTLVTFLASAGALGPGFRKSFLAGVAGRAEPAEVLRGELRTIGLASERAMFAATAGVNTHKGSVFAFGLLLGAAGRMIGRGEALDADGVCDEVALLVSGIVERELAVPREWRTAGERLYALHGLTGARGEAASGFATVRDHGLPAYRRMIAAGHDTETALLEAFLTLLAVNRDTNVAARGGIDGLVWARAEARALLDAGGLTRPDGRARLEALDDAFIARNLSPGGSADLLAVTWFLANLDA